MMGRHVIRNTYFSTIKKAVCQYYMDGILVAEYESATEATRITGISNSQIGRCCKGYISSAGGYIWEYKGNPPRIIDVDTYKKRMEKPSIHYSFKSKAKPVCQYQIDGTFVAEYESACEAARITGINNAQIGACCKDNRLYAGGYVWKFKQNDNN